MYRQIGETLNTSLLSLQSCPKAGSRQSKGLQLTWCVMFSNDFSREACAVSASKKVVGERTVMWVYGSKHTQHHTPQNYAGGNPSTSFQTFSSAGLSKTTVGSKFSDVFYACRSHFLNVIFFSEYALFAKRHHICQEFVTRRWSMSYPMCKA
jgi:hypothetical protein